VKIVLGLGTLSLIALGVGITVWLTAGGNRPVLTHVAYARLFARAIVRETRIGVLDQWPKPPYQTFGDNFGNQCFEWFDRPKVVYTLCFKNGLLAIKSSN
jgi:hypothetical protein